MEQERNKIWFNVWVYIGILFGMVLELSVYVLQASLYSSDQNEWLLLSFLKMTTDQYGVFETRVSVD